MLSTSNVDCNRRVAVLRKWAASPEGKSLRAQLMREFRESQELEQLALTLSVLLVYGRWVSDALSGGDRPPQRSFLDDWNAYLSGQLIGSSKAVAERMMLALLRVLHAHGSRFEDVIAFLETTLHMNPLPLHVYDGLSDHYLQQRVERLTHDVAFEATMAELIQSKSPDLKDDDSAWIEVKLEDTSPLDPSPASTMVPGNIPPMLDLERDYRHHLALPLGFFVTDYKLVRLSGVDRQDCSTVFNEIGETEVPSTYFLGNRTWEIVILDSFCLTLQDRLSTKIPNSVLDLDYSPIRPTGTDLARWGDAAANDLCWLWFLRRALRMIQHGRPITATYYSYYLGYLSGFQESTDSNLYTSTEVPFLPTYRGAIDTREEAFLLVQGCICGEFNYSRRGPKLGEITYSDSTFVWEEHMTGIDSWKDGIEWTRIQDGIEMGVFVDGPELMRRMYTISACGSAHYVVSYHTASMNLSYPDVEADRIKLIPRDMRDQMPKDLLQYLAKQPSLVCLQPCERQPANVFSEVKSEGSFEIKIYYPPVTNKLICRVVVWIPGGKFHYSHLAILLTFVGILGDGVDRDTSTCSNMAQGLSFAFEMYYAFLIMR